jgi:hypothetical protein
MVNPQYKEIKPGISGYAKRSVWYQTRTPGMLNPQD